MDSPALLLNESTDLRRTIAVLLGFNKTSDPELPTHFSGQLHKLSRVTGDFGKLAAKNVRRNPARIAAIAFLIAFIIGYGVQVTAQTASQHDYLVRQVESSAGADISLGSGKRLSGFCGAD